VDQVRSIFVGNPKTAIFGHRNAFWIDALEIRRYLFATEIVSFFSCSPQIRWIGDPREIFAGFVLQQDDFV
jgi:hypothetical protein